MSSLSLNKWKGLSMAVFTGMSIIGAFLAVVMKERAKQLYVTCGVVFSAGVLLAGGFVHLLSDCNDQFEELDITNFQWAFAIAGITVVGLECLEITLDRLFDNYVHSEKNTEEWLKKKRSTSQTAIQDPYRGTSRVDLNVEGQEENNDNEEGSSVQEGIDLHDHDHDHDHAHFITTDSPFSSVLLTMALSIHSIIEGLGIGASDDISQIRSAFIAVAFHKGFTAFALANGLVSSGYWEDRTKRKYFYLSVGTFILLAIVGISIGWAISAADSSLTTAVLIGVTSGSFIYVATLEIMPQETKIIAREHLSILPVVFCFLSGYCLMAILAIWA